MTTPDDTLETLTLATSSARAVLVTAAHLESPKRYPYTHVTGRSDEAASLRAWLLGGREQYDKDRRPLGGAALVTGFRGVGKSTLVNKVLFDVSLAGLYGARFVDKPDWGPFDGPSLKARVSRAEQSGASPGDHMPRLYVPVHVDVANAIGRRDLMERVLRRTYFTLSRYQIGALHPDLMRRVRLAYLRTLGKLEASASAKVNEKFTSALGVNLETISKLEVTAQQEMEFAETLKLIAEDLSVEEMEDELIDLGGELSDGAHGAEDAVGRRIGSTVSRAWNLGYLRLRQLFWGDVGRQVHLVYVFDELDKLDDAAPPTRELLTSTASVIQQLKILFSTTGVSAFVIAGVATEERWLDEVAERDPLLRSVFSRHVYVPQLPLKAVRTMFEGFNVLPSTSAAITFWTRGRYKQLLRARGAQRAGRLDDEFPHVSHEVLERILGDFGGTDLKQLSSTSLTQGITAAKDLEALAAVLLAGAAPITRREAFGADVLRTLLLRVAVEYLDPTLHFATPPPEREQQILSWLVEFVPSPVHHAVQSALRRIVGDALRPAAVLPSTP